ncbi:MAG: CotH kinase family protein [Phycisphaerales bacterium]|nr:CotH kinase family protein [Phycisphaerales bacterium]
MRRHKLTMLAMMLASAAPMSAWGHPVVISEFMAKNDNTLEDEDGDSSDWIELCNISNAPINLGDWSLTDDPELLDKWIFPTIQLLPGQSLIVFASDKDRTDPQQPLHTNFKLSANGEYLGLVGPDSTVIHDYAPAFPEQQEDIAYGLVADITPTSIIAASSQAHVHVPESENGHANWYVPEFDDAKWPSGSIGIGYDTDDEYDPYIGFDIEAEMYGQASSALIRIHFQWFPDDMTGLPLTLLMQYDDGFACWLNGSPVAQSNAPNLDDLTWNSHATDTRDDEAAVIPEHFSLDLVSTLLTPGSNILAIQSLNDNITSPDLLLSPLLIGNQGSYLSEPTYLSESTPGQLNIAEGVGIGPEMDDMEHEPSHPEAGESITIRCEVEAEDTDIASVSLVVRRDFNEESAPLDMAQINNDTWEITIPGGEPGEIIRWYAMATDIEGDISTFPAHIDPFNSPQYQGVHVQNPIDTQLHVIRLFVEDLEAMDVPDTGTRCVVVHEGLLYDNVLVRPRGQTSLNWPKQSYKLDFNSDHHIDFLGEGDPQEELSLQSNYSDKSTLRRLLSWEAYEQAGTLCSRAIPVRLHLNGQFHSLSTYVEQVDKRMLERVGLDPEGALYKMFNSCNSYWVNVEKKTREHENNLDLKIITDGIVEEDLDLLRIFLLDNLDIPAVLAYLATTNLIHHNDQVSKNYYLYRDTEGDGEWQFIPWDKDMTFGRNAFPDKGLLNDVMVSDTDPSSHPLFGDEEHPKVNGKWNRLTDAIFRVPEIREMYLRHLRTQMDMMLQPPGTAYPYRQFENRIDELLTLTNSEIILDRITWPYEWGEPQTIEVAVDHLINDFLEPRRVHFYVTHGELGGLIPAPQADALDITFGQIQAQPASGNSDEEFIQLINNEETPVDISGWRLDGDVTFTFAAGSVIPANGHVFVSPDIKAFRSRSQSPQGGEGHLVLGPFSGHIAFEPCEKIYLISNNGIMLDSVCANLIGDLNGDGVVDVNDILIVISDYGCTGNCVGDANLDQQVDTNDVLIILENWGY